MAICLFTSTSCDQAAKKTDAATPVMTSAKPDLAKIKADIQAGNNVWAAASDALDTAKVLSFFADDAISMQDDKPTIFGKPAIKKSLEESLSKRKNTKELTTFVTTEVFGDDKCITELGTVAVKDTTGKVTYTGKYTTVWENRNGKWVVIRDMSNDDAPQKK